MATPRLPDLQDDSHGFWNRIARISALASPLSPSYTSEKYDWEKETTWRVQVLLGVD